MNVNGLGKGIIGRLGTPSDVRPLKHAGASDAAGRPEKARPAAAPVPRSEEGEANSDADSQVTGEKGVIRLLQEGHFKGVADVRLRINFYDELSAQAAAAAAQSMTVGAGDLISNVTAKAQELVVGWGLGKDAQKAADDLLTQFEAAAQAALGESTSNGLVDRTGLADALRTAFDSFSEQLAALAPPPVDATDPATGNTTDPVVTEPPPPELPTETSSEVPPPVDASAQPAVDPPVADDTSVTTDVPATDTQSAAAPQEPVTAATDIQTPLVANPDIESLRQLFADGLAKLLASGDEASQLPPLASQPTGSGKAYSKFAAIYNRLIGQASPAEPSTAPGDEHVDVVL
jgi:hypothetical protein